MMCTAHINLKFIRSIKLFLRQIKRTFSYRSEKMHALVLAVFNGPSLPLFFRWDRMVLLFAGDEVVRFRLRSFHMVFPQDARVDWTVHFRRGWMDRRQRRMIRWPSRWVWIRTCTGKVGNKKLQKSTKLTKTPPILIFFYCTAVVLLTFVDFC
jgi:hypothetical protein